MYRYTITHEGRIYGRSQWLYATKERCNNEANVWKNSILDVIKEFGFPEDTNMRPEDWVITIEQQEDRS